MGLEFVGTMVRHFRGQSFPFGKFNFRFDGTLFPIVRVDDTGVYYGKQPWCMNRREIQYKIKSISHSKRSILGRKCIIDIDTR